AGPVAVAGNVFARFDHDTLVAVPPHGDKGSPRFTFAVPPACETLTLADEALGALGNRFRRRWLVHGPHYSPTLSFRSQLQPEVGGELVRHVEPERCLAPHESHDGSTFYSGCSLNRNVGHTAIRNRLLQCFGHRLSGRCHRLACDYYHRELFQTQGR